METFIKRDYYKNWVAATEFPIEDNRVVTIRTRKASNGSLSTFVSVGKKDGDFISTMLFQDYGKHVMITNPKRITEKLVSEQHAIVLDDIDSILSDIKVFYSKEMA